MLLGWFFAVVFLASSHAAANSIESAKAAFDDGRFLEAAQIAETLNTAESLTLANVSLVTYGYYIAEDDEKQMFFVRAMELGERAVSLGPADALSHLRWGHAMGRYTQTIGKMTALQQGLAGRIRDAFERAIELAPDMAHAHSSMGNWHWEAVKEAGILARATLGASKKSGARHFEKALELDPESKIVLFNYGRGLLVLNKRKDRERAREILERSLNIPPLNAAERLLDEEISRKLAELAN